MLPFIYERADTLHEALSAMEEVNQQPPTDAPSQFIAGGTNMSDYMRLGVNRPSRLVDINPIQETAMRTIALEGSELRLGALVRMSEAEDHAEINRRCPMLSESLKLAASRQIRNMATLGGNLLQRTRCEYFREISWPCNKRLPGSGCSAMDGFNRQHAILGVSDSCIATYHGDFAQALIALDASIEIQGRDANRRLPISELHRLPEDRPDIETVLRPDEMITAIIVQIPQWASRSTYLKVRDRQSYAFALASTAVALDLDDKNVRDVRIGLGGLATVPWRAVTAEDVLRGRPLTEEAANAAADAAFAEAKPREHNSFKVELGKQTLVRALMEVREMSL
ncbi:MULTISPECIES: xanthine dehydrogenase family protein subunit M [unclassified Rhizobium]|uniref:FAD binding domain-containing protein n=1 Tax=unclassified Rhizobium TaxID=2613769 RepID=UPI0021670F4A|nr:MULTISPECIES: xanthine dehydrogenase family protein subunit M [unclassified Rhizobium]MCS3744107.1 xanthine dehydrogenase YagS FAD-binding subunit [Rhizobium sp. BK661]MCS4096585.1 xanthine dehydrogenase YagS FAD-binding subunit [Rhizobium sp. BK176]